MPEKFIFIFIYLLLSAVCIFLFRRVGNSFIKDITTTPHSIDEHVMKSYKLFDAGYVIKAGQFGYDHGKCFRSFFD